MADKHAIARYRRWYRRLLCLYSRPHRERFAESMEQTFSDLCRERAETGDRLIGFVFWTFVETSAGIFRERMTSNIMQKNIIRLAIVVGLLLLFPWWANHNIDGWNWDLFDFVVMGVLLFGTGLTYELVARKGGTIACRAAVGIACAGGLLLVWVNAAVGIIGDVNSANVMYLGVVAVGFIGASIARLQPRGMSRALFATAVAQALVPLIALTWVPAADFSPGVVKVLGLNAFWVVLWIVSALLFRHAGEPGTEVRQAEQGSRLRA